MNALRLTIVLIIVVLSGAIFAAWHWKSNAQMVGTPQVESRWDNWDNTPTPPPKKPEKAPVNVQPVPSQVDTLVIPRSYKQALDLSRKTGKLVFFYFTSEKCDYCTKMQKETLSDPKIKVALSQYIVYEIDVNGLESYVAAGVQVKMVPYYLICNADRKILKTGIGYKSPLSFKSWLQ